MTHSNARPSHGRGPTEPRDVHARDEAEPTEVRGAPRPVARSEVGWRYGSALAAARALNARPVRA